MCKRADICRVVITAAALAILVGCNDQATTNPTLSSASITASVAPAPPPPKLGRKRPIGPVYVDGKLLGVLRYGELPRGFKPTVVQRSNEDYTLINIPALLEAYGVDVEKLKAVLLLGGRRMTQITGNEVRRRKDVLRFAFQKRRGTTGGCLMDWPKELIESTMKIDRLTGIYALVDKEPLKYDQPSHSWSYPDGKVMKGVPYAPDAKPILYARIHVDDKLFGFIDISQKIPADVIRPGNTKGGGKKKREAKDEGGGKGKGGRYYLAKYLAHRGIDLSKLKAMDFIGDDRAYGRLDLEGWNKAGDKMIFGVPMRKRDKVRMELPEEATPYPGKANVQAIYIYVDTEPPEREIIKPKRRPKPKK